MNWKWKYFPSLRLGRSNTETIRIEPKERFCHIYLIGKTGKGKSSLIRIFAFQDSYYGFHAMIFLDPSGMESEGLLGVLNPKRKVRYCSLQRPISLNLLRHPSRAPPYDGHEKEVIFDTVCEAINQAVAYFTPGQSALTAAMRDLFRPFIFRELDQPHPSLKAVIDRILDDRNLRGGDADSLKRVAHRLSNMLSDEKFNRIISGANAFNWDAFIERGEILVVDGHGMTHGQQLFLGNTVTKSLTAYLMYTKKPNNLFPPCAIYIDEFEKFVSSRDFEEITRRARKFQISLLVAHQDMANVRRSPFFASIYHMIHSNAGSILSFRVGAYESKVLANEFTNVKFQQIKDVDDYHLHARIGKEEYLIHIPRPPIPAKVKFINSPTVGQAPPITEETDQPFQLNVWRWEDGSV